MISPALRRLSPGFLRPRLLRTASFRLAGLYLGLFLLSALLLDGAVFLAASSALEQQTAARIDTEAGFLRDEFRTGGVDQLRSLVQLRGRGARALDYLVQDRRGTRLAGEMPAIQAPRPGWITIEVTEASEDHGRPERTKVLLTSLGDGLLLGVGGDLDRVTDLEKAVATAFLWTVGLVAVLGIGGGALLSRTFLNRVDAIASTAEAIIEGDLARRVPVSGTRDDLDRLAGTLNRMLDRIEALMGSLRQVSSDVAHDLRTPLSRLFQRLEDARTRARSVPEYETAIEAASLEAEGLLATFSALLRIAQVEGGSPRAGFGDVNLSSVAETVADAFRPDAEEAGHRIITSLEPGIHIRGDQELLTQAVANLVENALRHTPTGTSIWVDLSHPPGPFAHLSVRDDGPGAGAEDLPRLAHRFYRGERGRTTPGNGLGLALVAAVAELHGATLKLSCDHRDRDPASPAGTGPGLLVSLLFPASTPRLKEFTRCLPSSNRL